MSKANALTSFPEHGALTATVKREGGNILGGLHRYMSGVTQQHLDQGHRKLGGPSSALAVNQGGRKDTFDS
jgi:hypothetical protein